MTVNVKKARVRKGNKIKSPCFCRQGNIKNGRVHVHANQSDQMWEYNVAQFLQKSRKK